MTDIYGWDFRQLYEQPPVDLLEAEAFFAAFAKFHDIDGHSLNCILSKAKFQPVTLLSSDNLDGGHAVTSVLIVRDSDIWNIEQGAALKVDGTHCRVIRVSRPVIGLTRLELEGFSG